MIETRPTLGRAVVRLTEVAMNADGGGCVDNTAVLLLLEDRPGSLGSRIGASNVDLVDEVPLGVGHGSERFVAQDTGILYVHRLRHSKEHERWRRTLTRMCKPPKLSTAD